MNRIKCSCNCFELQKIASEKKNYVKRSSNKRFSAFTLAEMMVVMLIMSIILAAMAPVMTTRNKADNSSPWRYSPDNFSDAYFGPGDRQIAMLGQPNKLETDDAAKLIINSSDILKTQISFKQNNTTVGRLMIKDKNLLLGDSTFDKQTTGENNISIGDGNLTELTTGENNIAIGSGALVNNTEGGNNVALGNDCLKENVDGSYNVAVGYYTLKNSKGVSNTAVGANALENLERGSSHVAIGIQALNVFNGPNRPNEGNTAVGGYSMANTTTGISNTAIGYGALRDNLSGNQNVSVGYRSNWYSDGTKINSSNTVAIGADTKTQADEAIAIGLMSEASGHSSIAIGSNTDSAGVTRATQNYAVAIGNGARALGESSTALGDVSFANEDNSIAIGKGAQVVRKSGYNAFSDGIAIGTNARVESSSCDLWPCSYTAGIAIGQDAYTMSSDAVVIGYATNAQSGSVSIGGNASTERHSVAIGYNAKALDSSVAIGYGACNNVTGHNKICIGDSSGPKSGSSWASDNIERIFIGSKSKFDNGTAVLEVHNTTKKEPYINDYNINETAVVVHGSLIVTGPIYNNVKDKDGTWRHWQLLEVDQGGDKALWSIGTTGPFFRDYIGDSDVPTQNPAPSDRRLKYVGKEFTSGLDKIRQLKVFNYTFKKDEKKIPHVGVMAQDLQKIFPNAVKKGADGFLSIRMEDMFYAMINAIKELDLKYQAQEKRIDELEKRIEKLEAKIK